ncbi:MAG: NAD(P)H-binding protein [Acetobacteraceae bacterium]
MMLLTGASGRVGRRTAELLARNRMPLRLMTRTPEKAPHLAEVEIVHGDFAEPDTLEAAFDGIDVALIISGSAQPGMRALHHRNAFLAAARSPVRQVIYLSLQGSGAQSKFAYSRDHYESEQFLSDAGLPSFTILRNAFYMDMLPEFAGADGAVRDPLGQGRAAFISREDVARTAAAAMLSPPGGVHDVTGPEALSVAEAVRRLSLLTGVPLRCEHEGSGSAQGGRTGLGTEEWRADLYTGWFAAIAAGELERVSPTVKRLTGIDPMTFEGYFSAFPEALGPLHLPPSVRARAAQP